MTENKQLSAIYRFLAQAMRYPEAEWLNEIFKEQLLELLNSLQWQDEAAALSFDPASPHDLEIIQVEHTRLFISAAGGVYASPYGSVYLSKSGTLLNESTDEVRDFYRRNGFDLADDYEVADHIVNELEFLSLLTANNMPKEEQEFLKVYFRPWFTTFAEQVKEAAEIPFYKVVIKLIDFFTKDE